MAHALRSGERLRLASSAQLLVGGPPEAASPKGTSRWPFTEIALIASASNPMHHKAALARAASATFSCAAIELLQFKRKESTKRKRAYTEIKGSAGARSDPTTSSKSSMEPGDHHDHEDAAANKRLQYKMYQRRHRARQQEKTRRLEAEVEQLTQEITSLSKMHAAAVLGAGEASERGPGSESLASCDALAGRPAQLVQEYIRLFEYGYSPTNGHAQESFVRLMMAADVQGSHFNGVDEVLDQWRLYHQVFSAVHLMAQDMQVESLDEHQVVVTVAVTLKLRLGRAGAISLFPSLRARDELLFEELEDRSLVVDGSLRFVVDATNHVSWIGAEMDFASALTLVTGSFREACLCLEDAQLDLSTGYIHPGVRGVADQVMESEGIQAAPTGRLDLSFILSDA